MIKILIVLTRYDGGVGRVVNSINNILKNYNFETKIISREDDLKCYSLKKSFSILRKEVRKYKYDYLYSQDWSIALPLLFLKNHYCCYHGIEPNKIGRLIQWIIGHYFGNKLIVVGDKLNKKYPKSNLIYNGVNTSEFYNMNKKREKVGWIEREWEEKTKDEILSIAKELKLPLTIAKGIPKEKMNEWYNGLAVFISYPKEITGFNLCWLEAKASGVPIISGNNNGIGIKKILDEPLENFTWEKNVNKLIKVLK
jgi:hypothetical protein